MRHSKREFQKAHPQWQRGHLLIHQNQSSDWQKFRLTGLFRFCCNLANHRSKSSQKLKHGKCSQCSQCSQCSAENVHSKYSNILKYSVSPSSNLVQPRPTTRHACYRSQAQRHASAATRPSPTYGGPPDHPMSKLSNKTPREPESWPKLT